MDAIVKAPDRPASLFTADGAIEEGRAAYSDDLRLDRFRAVFSMGAPIRPKPFT
jgi:hypothetical protein